MTETTRDLADREGPDRSPGTSGPPRERVRPAAAGERGAPGRAAGIRRTVERREPDPDERECRVRAARVAERPFG
ncbi:hypothetical protein ACFUCQ_23680 [Streptomyces sp. NPDC057197]|uniref:hypothetical protein n=1 Tax=unclassified Streptomyces TaxID=2593676 RepID=UPI0007DCCE79|nr:hypothetical protein [Streptomyces sp. SAT1]ANH95002.1 hypothetical protein A8713_30705 [Streptomyces sp. SAT1]